MNWTKNLGGGGNWTKNLGGGGDWTKNLGGGGVGGQWSVGVRRNGGGV